MSDQQIPIIDLPWPDPAIPKYRRTRLGEWTMASTPSLGPNYGYFRVNAGRPRGWVIQRSGKNIWMSLTAMEIESHMPHLAAARGHTVIAGLGMGFALYNIMQRPEVTHVTVLECDPDLVGLLDRSTNWRRWPGHEKVELVMCDALTYRPDAPVDFLYADIWPLMAHDDALPQTQIMQRNIQAAQVGYWTQEWDYVNVTRFSPSQASYRSFARRVGLPLIEQDNPRYPQLAFAAVTLQLLAQQLPGEVRDALIERYAMFATGRMPDRFQPIPVPSQRAGL